jgi:hypothetical protein
VEINELIVRDDKLDVGDNKVASSEVAKGRTCVGRTAEVMRIGPGTTPVDDIGTIHVGEWNQTSEELDILEYCWILRSSGTPVLLQGYM